MSLPPPERSASEHDPHRFSFHAPAVELLRLGMGVVWILNLLFIVDPKNHYFSSFATTALSYAPTTFGGPGLAEFAAAHATFFAWSIALVTAYLAVAFLLGFTTRIACFVGSFFSALLLATQIGTTFVFPGGTDVGPHPLYILIYGVLLVGNAGHAYTVVPWFRRLLAGWAATRPRRARAPFTLAMPSVSGRMVMAYFVAGTAISIGVGFGLVAALPATTPPTSTAAPGISYVNLTVIINPVNGWPQYTPANFSVPAGIAVITITDHDDVSPWPGCPCRVTGTLGNTEQVNTSTLPVVPATNVAHTFTAPDLGLSVYSPGQSVVTFRVDLSVPGHYFWMCLAPCGQGTDAYTTGPMGVVGYMQGTITVT